MVILLLKISVYCSNVPACWKTKRELRHRLRSPRNAETLIQTRELRGFSDGVHSNRHSNKRKWCILTIISGKNWIRLKLTITSRRSYTSTWARIMKYTLFLLKIYNLMQKLWHRCMTKKNAGGRISETNTANSEAIAQWFTETSKTFIIIVFYVSWMRLWDVFWGEHRCTTLWSDTDVHAKRRDCTDNPFAFCTHPQIICRLRRLPPSHLSVFVSSPLCSRHIH